MNWGLKPLKYLSNTSIFYTFLPFYFSSSNFFSIFLLFSNSTFFLDSFDNTLQMYAQILMHFIVVPFHLDEKQIWNWRKPGNAYAYFGRWGTSSNFHQILKGILDQKGSWTAV